MKKIILQLQFLTRIPFPLKIYFDKEQFAGSFIYAPFIGLLLGLLYFLIYRCLFVIDDKYIVSFLIVLGSIILTGGLHLDGLADTFDGIFSNRSSAEILKIMKDSNIGTFGVLVLITVLIGKILFLSSIPVENIGEVLILMPVLSRLNICWSAGISTYARKEGGLGEEIVKRAGPKQIITSTILTLIILITISFCYKDLFLVLFILPIVLFSILFTKYIEKKIGGITGDVIGAIVELSEMFFLFLMVLRYAIF